MGAETEISSASASDNGPIGVAMSGGGVRAALFSMGALLYLVDSGYSASVKSMASVSGGSLTNGLIAQSVDFSTTHEDTAAFEAVVESLVDAVAGRGLISRWLLAIAYGVPTVLLLSVWWWSWPIAFPLWADLLLPIAVGGLWMLRGRLVAYQFARVLRTRARGRGTRMSELTTPVEHVICATDLETANPFYFTSLGKGIEGSAKLGFYHVPERRLADAVRASAAFPGGISPARVKLRADRIINPKTAATQRAGAVTWAPARAGRDSVERPQSGEPPPLPKVVHLSDGGVWNNLATQWFEDSKTDLTLVGLRAQTPTRQIVIDASAPLRAQPRLWYLRVPLLAELLGFLRIIKIQYLNTVRPRIDELNASTIRSALSEDARVRVGGSPRSAVVELGKDQWREPIPFDEYSTYRIWVRTPGEALQILERAAKPVPDLAVESSQAPIGRVGRAAGIRRWLGPRAAPVSQPPSLVAQASQMPTTLFRVSREDAMSLLLHGYLNAGRKVGVMFGERLAARPLPSFAKLAGVLDQWRKRAARHDLDAMVNLGWALATDGDKEGVALLEQAARAGHPFSAYRLGLLHEQSSAPDEAIEWYRAAADGGVPAAEYRIAVLLSRKPGQEHAIRQWKRAAGLKAYPPAVADLAFELATEADQRPGDSALAAEAEAWLLGASHLGIPGAAARLGMRLLEEPGHEDAGKTWLLKAALAGDVDANRALGLYYTKEGDSGTAHGFLHDAAIQGDATAQYHLGRTLDEEKGQTADAERWLREAADSGSAVAADAAFQLVLLLEQQDGRAADVEQICDTLREAAKRDDAEAAYHLGTLHFRSSSDPQDQDWIEAEHWLRKAVGEGHTDAMILLSVIAAHGPGGEHEKHDLLRQAAAAGSQRAVKLLQSSAGG